MILHWDNSGPISADDEAAIRARVAAGEHLIKTEMDMRNGSPPFPSFDWLLSPDELSILAQTVVTEPVDQGNGPVVL